MPMTEEQLLAIKERAEAATPGPWVFERPYGMVLLNYTPKEPRICESSYLGSLANRLVCDMRSDWRYTYKDKDEPRANAVFIAHAREDVPALLAEVDRLRAREEWLARELAVQGNARGYESFCPMPGDYNCAWRQGCDLCGAQIKARAECWRKAADTATRETQGSSGDVPESARVSDGRH